VLTLAHRLELRLCDARLLRPLHESRLLLALPLAHWPKFRLLRPLHKG
jgi:hypothetical protein